MRTLIVALLVCLSGCAGFADSSRVDGITLLPDGKFQYAVATNTALPPNEDSAAERIRRSWLAQTLGANGLCHKGWVLDSRHYVVHGPGPFGTGGVVVYRGHCL